MRDQEEASLLSHAYPSVSLCFIRQKHRGDKLHSCPQLPTWSVFIRLSVLPGCLCTISDASRSYGRGVKAICFSPDQCSVLPYLLIIYVVGAWLIILPPLPLPSQQLQVSRSPSCLFISPFFFRLQPLPWASLSFCLPGIRELPAYAFDYILALGLEPAGLNRQDPQRTKPYFDTHGVHTSKLLPELEPHCIHSATAGPGLFGPCISTRGSSRSRKVRSRTPRRPPHNARADLKYSPTA